ncbi:Xylosyltransferase oxt-like [Homarus americanus]|uniref:protein xylosyltransferase n=1 Tax=Homarus americanus TaxID=6706 RepID=A0A8J5MMQ1_HOMAM|nr:Xylosyltransferase oxt-like [Homarus americanus]
MSIADHGYHMYTTIKKTTVEKDIGVVIDDKMTFSDHLAEKINKANKIRSQVDVESRVYQANDKGDADSHNKGPPDVAEVDSKELSKEWLGIDTPCKIRSRESLSAIKRATTVHCKTVIANISCQIQAGSFYPVRLQSYCPSNGKVRGKHVGCFVDSRENRILRGHAGQLKRNTPTLCSDICYQRGYIYSGVQYGKECFCGNEEIPLQMKVADSLCNMPCTGDSHLKCGDYLHINIYQTGLAKYVPQALKGPSSAGRNIPVRIVFILTVNGRAMRQLSRLVKALYHKDHYFFIHVDSRQDYLFREVLKLEEQFDNIHVSRYRLSTIWGGASLLKILLHCMQQVLQIKSWNWDFVINLSESDYPIKKNEELVSFLTNNKERNFLKSHGHDTNRFLQKQGLDRTFLECETHMWRIGERRLPLAKISWWEALRRFIPTPCCLLSHSSILFSATHASASLSRTTTFMLRTGRGTTPGLESYWENRYHHEDKPSSNNDAALTLYHAGARLSTQSLSHLITTEKNDCAIYATSVLQAYSYHVSDTFKGVVIQFVGTISGQGTFHLETWIFPHVKYRLPFEKPNHRLTDLEVGTDFDVKEQVFRNFGGAMGPNSDVTVATRWSGGVTGDERVVSHNFELRKPLLPGSWMMRVLIDNVVIASHSFLILPLQFVQGRQISVKEARMLHKGPSEPYTNADLSHSSLLLSLGQPGNSSAQEVSALHSHLHGPKLSNWIDNLVTRFYTIQDSCYIPSQHVPECVHVLLDSCTKNIWSSQSPDPKSHLGEIDPKTGKIVDSYRIGNSEFR